ETEDVVDEKEYVLPFFITEVFRHCQACKCNAHTCTRRLVHLAEDHCSLLDYSGIFHFVIKVVTLTCTFSDTGEYCDTAMFLCDVVDQFLDKDCISDTVTAKESDLPPFCLWGNQIIIFTSFITYFYTLIGFSTS